MGIQITLLRSDCSYLSKIILRSVVVVVAERVNDINVFYLCLFKNEHFVWIQHLNISL